MIFTIPAPKFTLSLEGEGRGEGEFMPTNGACTPSATPRLTQNPLPLRGCVTNPLSLEGEGWGEGEFKPTNGLAHHQQRLV